MVMVLRYAHELLYQVTLLPYIWLLIHQRIHLFAGMSWARTQACANLCREHAFGRQANRKTDTQLHGTLVERALTLEAIDERSTGMLFAKLAMPDGPLH